VRSTPGRPTNNLALISGIKQVADSPQEPMRSWPQISTNKTRHLFLRLQKKSIRTISTDRTHASRLSLTSAQITATHDKNRYRKYMHSIAETRLARVVASVNPSCDEKRSPNPSSLLGSDTGRAQSNDLLSGPFMNCVMIVLEADDEFEFDDDEALIRCVLVPRTGHMPVLVRSLCECARSFNTAGHQDWQPSAPK
jgi:hypothetical protein